MGKRDFRQAHHQDVQPTYPRQLRRREFLAGAFVVVGGGAVLSACGGRPIGDEPKPKPNPNPHPPTPPEHFAGGAPMPPAPADAGPPPKPDVHKPDTTHDSGEPDSDPEHWAGGMPGPPAAIDAAPADDSDCPLP